MATVRVVDRTAGYGNPHPGTFAHLVAGAGGEGNRLAHRTRHLPHLVFVAFVDVFGPCVEDPPNPIAWPDVLERVCVIRRVCRIRFERPWIADERPVRMAIEKMSDFVGRGERSEEHTSELQSRFGISYA